MKRVVTLLLIALLAFGMTACKDDATDDLNDPNDNQDNTEEVEEQEEVEEIVVYKNSLKIHGGILFTLNPHMYQLDSEERTLSFIASSFYRREISINSELGYEYIDDMANGDPLCVEEGINDGEPCHEWQIEVRDGLKLNEGTPYAIDVLIDSYKLLLDPYFMNYNANVFYSGLIVENAEAYNYQHANAEEVDWEDVGIKKVDPYTMKLVLETPEMNDENGIHMMKSYLSSFALAPVDKDLYLEESTKSGFEASTRYGTELEYLVSNGPYNLTAWEKEERDVIPREYQKSDTYIDKDSFELDKIIESVYYGINNDNEKTPKSPVPDFEAGRLDFINVPSFNYEDFYQEYEITSVDTTTVWALSINGEERKLTSEQEQDCWEFNDSEICYYDNQYMTDDLLENQKFRMALYYLLDRAHLHDEFLQGQKPTNHLLADAFLSNYLTGERYRDTQAGRNVYNNLADKTYGFDEEYAKTLYTQAREELEFASGYEVRVGIQVPSGDKTLLNIAQWLKETIEGPSDEFKPLFRYLKIEIEEVEISDYYTNMINGKYDLSFVPISGDQNDPYSAMYQFHSMNSRQMQYGYENSDVDKIYNALVQNKTVTLSQVYQDSQGNDLPQVLEDLKYGDENTRLELLALQERLIMEDMFVIPIYEVVENYVYSDALDLPYTNPIGSLGFGSPLYYRVKDEN